MRIGELELMVPKDWAGQFHTELFERYGQSEKALVLAITQMYVDGVSTRKVRDITYPYLMIDARHEKVRRGGQVISHSVLWRSA